MFSSSAISFRADLPRSQQLVQVHDAPVSSEPALAHPGVQEGASCDVLQSIRRPEVALAVWKRELPELADFLQHEAQRPQSRFHFSYQSDRLPAAALRHALSRGFVDRFEDHEKAWAQRILEDVVDLEALFRVITNAKTTTLRLETKGELSSETSQEAANQACQIHVDHNPYILGCTYFGSGTITHPQRTGLCAEDEGLFSKVSVTNPYQLAAAHVGLWRGSTAQTFAAEIPANALAHQAPVSSARRFFCWITGW